LTREEISRLTEKLYAKFKGVPGLDRNFIQKCLLGISGLADEAVEAELSRIIKLL